MGAKSEWDKHREREKSTVELRRAVIQHWCYGSETQKKPSPGEVSGVQNSPASSALEELHAVIQMPKGLGKMNHILVHKHLEKGQETFLVAPTASRRPSQLPSSPFVMFLFCLLSCLILSPVCL